jgi:hypothetical protein
MSKLIVPGDNVPVTHRVLSSTGVFVKKVAREFGLRKGMWVTTQTAEGMATGILTQINEGGDVVVDLTNQDGHTDRILKGHASNLRQATFSEIPVPRRPHPQLAAAAGYI